MKQLVMLLMGLILSCSSNTGKETKTLLVNSFKVPCTGVAPLSCLQIKESSEDSQWSNFYNPIEGFDYEPGYLYTIEVTVESVPEEQIVADGSSLKYALVKVVDKVADVRLRINDIWVLDTMKDVSVSEIFKKLPVLEIHLGSNSYLGNDGCNNYNGYLEFIDELQIEFGMAVSTKMACPNDNWSFKYAEYLMSSDNYKIENGSLILLKGEEILLTFNNTD